MASNSSLSMSSSQVSDVLMIDPILDYLNQILMDDATPMPHVDDASYQAIFRGFYYILGEHLPPNSYLHSAGVVDPHVQHQIMYSNHEIKGPHEQRVKVFNPNDGFYSITNAPRISLPANGHPENDAEVLQHDAGFQGHVMASPTPSMSTQIFGRLHGMLNYNYNSGSLLNSTGLNEANISLFSKIDTMAQISVKLNDGALMVVMIPCWGKDAVVEGLSGHRCIGWLEQGYGNFKLPSADEEFSSTLAQVDLSFKDLKLNGVYTDLYVGEPSSLGSSSRAASNIKHTLAGYGSKSGKKSTSEVHMYVDVREVLVSCAQAVAIGDVKKASAILQELRQVHGASANGTCLQRLAHFFREALAIRLSGMGEQHFKAISHNMPAAAMLLRASKLGFEVTPFMKMMHYFANESILKAAEGASRLHVLDYESLYGMQWPCLINALADRRGGPPLLVITCIEFPQPGINLEERLEQSGRQLAAYAKTYGVPFQYHAIVTSNWEDLDTASLDLHEGEILVVNCLKRLHHLADLASTISPRQKFLTRMHGLNPHLLITAVMNAECNSPFFVSRFREALYFYSNVFDILDTQWGDTTQRLIVERGCCYREIVNIVACEGAERVERHEGYKQWHARITKAGFEQLPIPPTVVRRSRSHVKQHHHKDFFIHDDANGWMLMGWKGRVMSAISAWKPSLMQRC